MAPLPGWPANPGGVGGGVTLFLPCFVQTEGGGVSLSMGVLRISGGLWGGTAEGGGADNDPAPPAWKAKVINSSICSLLTSALRRLSARSLDSPTIHQPVTILRKTWRGKKDEQMLYCLCNFHIISREEKSPLRFNHAEWTWRLLPFCSTPPAPPPQKKLLQSLTVCDCGLWNWLTHTHTHMAAVADPMLTVDVVEQIKRINLLTPPNIKLGRLI